MSENHQQNLVYLRANSFQLQRIRIKRGNLNMIITITAVLNFNVRGLIF